MWKYLKSQLPFSATFDWFSSLNYLAASLKSKMLHFWENSERIKKTQTVQFATVAWLRWVFDLRPSTSDYTCAGLNNFRITPPERTTVMATCAGVTNLRLSFDRHDVLIGLFHWPRSLWISLSGTKHDAVRQMPRLICIARGSHASVMTFSIKPFRAHLRRLTRRDLPFCHFF